MQVLQSCTDAVSSAVLPTRLTPAASTTVLSGSRATTVRVREMERTRRRRDEEEQGSVGRNLAKLPTKAEAGLQRRYQC